MFLCYQERAKSKVGAEVGRKLDFNSLCIVRRNSLNDAELITAGISIEVLAVSSGEPEDNTRSV